MAYNVNQLQQLQDMIGMEADVPNAIDRYNAMKLLKQGQTGVRREEGGQLDLSDEAQDIASKGRYGDTMLMHVTPDEVRGLSSLRGGVTINPETGLPEAFLPAFLMPMLIGAGIGGVGSAITGGDPLKGAAFGALGGAMPAALGGIAGAAGGGVLSAWGALGPIGQGMLAGGAMGGIRSLFGDSDNPLRDIMLGAAMGGVGGAVFGGGEAGAAPVDATVDVGGTMYQPEVPSVLPSGVTTGPVAQTPIGYTANVHALRGGVAPQITGPMAQTPIGTATNLARPAIAPLSTAQAVKAAQPIGIGGNVPTDISSQAIRPQIAAPVQRTGFDEWISGKEGVETGKTFREYLTGTPADKTTTAAADVAAAGDDAAKTGLGAWWDRREPWEKWGIGGLGTLGALSLWDAYKDSPEELEEPDEIEPFPRLDPLPLRVQRDPLTEEEIVTAYGPSGSGIDSWFRPQVAKEGGPLSIIKREVGGPAGPGLTGYGSFGLGVTGGGQSGGAMGGPGYGGAVTGSIRTPYVAPPPPSAPPPPPPPEPIDPFVSNISSFNLQDALARITGGQAAGSQLLDTSGRKITLPTSSQLSALPAQPPIGAQGTSALSDLFSRFQQKQGDPIVDLVTASGAIPETLPAKRGGIVSLGAGGMFGGYTYGGPSGGSLSPGSAAAATAAAAASSSGGGGGSGGGSSGGDGGSWSDSGQTYTTTFSPTVIGPPLSEAGQKVAQALKGIVSGYEGMQSKLGLVGKLATPLGIQAIFGENSPMGLAGFAAALTNTGGYSPGPGPSKGTENPENDPYYVENPILETANQGGAIGLATGGVFEGRVQGNGDGMADQVAFNVVPQTPQDIPNTPDMALLSSDEYVIPADVVSMLGNGSSTAGAQSLDKFNQLMRRKAHGTNKQQKELNAGKELSSLV